MLRKVIDGGMYKGDIITDLMQKQKNELSFCSFWMVLHLWDNSCGPFLKATYCFRVQQRTHDGIK